MSNPAEFWDAFRQTEEDLWKACAKFHPEYRRQRYDGWGMCPRSHAEAHLRCIIEPGPLLGLAKQQFAQLNRFFGGDDLVFAVGDVQ